MTRCFSFRRITGAAWLGVLLFSSCASYHPMPLPVAPNLTRTPSLTAPARDFWLPGFKPQSHLFPKDGLDETAVITLAVFDDPDLKAARLQTGVAGAQLLEAGLLPDPQVNVDYARSVFAYGGDISLVQEIHALITRGAGKAAARANQKQVYLNILWQEWQVAERARELFIQACADDHLERVLSASRDLLANRYHLDEIALEKGDLTLGTVSAELATVANVETSLRQIQLNASLARHELNHLLGLQPGVELRFVGPINDPPLSQAEFRVAAAALPRRRPDLLALRAGYESRELSVREAVLAQFPALSIGVTQSRDPVEAVDSFGPNVTLTLPLFNRNRGQIAIERATRAVLHQTYEARLDQAVGSAGQLWKATNILQSQLRDLDARLPVMQSIAMAAKQDLVRYHLNMALYVSLESGFLATQAEAIRARAALEESRSSLSTVLGLPFGSG